MSTLRAGDIVLTRLEANRHRVMRSRSLARADRDRLPEDRRALCRLRRRRQKGREAWVTPDQWSIYDTTDSYAVANPVQVEHLIVMVPKERLVERGLSLEPLMARRLGGSGGVARLALETMRSAYRELPGMSRGGGARRRRRDHAARAPVDARPGRHRHRHDAARGAARAHQAARAEHLGDARLSVDSVAWALNCSRRHLYNAFAEEPDGVAGYILPRRLEACCQCFDDRAHSHRSITEIALGFGFSSMAHFSRVFRSHVGVSPSDYRRAAGSLAA